MLIGKGDGGYIVGGGDGCWFRKLLIVNDVAVMG